MGDSIYAKQRNCVWCLVGTQYISPAISPPRYPFFFLFLSWFSCFSFLIVPSSFPSLSPSVRAHSPFPAPRTLAMALLNSFVHQTSVQTGFPERPRDNKFLVHVVNRLIGFRGPNLAHIQNVIMTCALIGFSSFGGHGKIISSNSQ